MSDSIALFINEYRDTKRHLEDIKEISISIRRDEHYKKILLLSCASFYEMKITNALKVGFLKCSPNQAFQAFVRHKAIERQYHTYFEWNPDKANNINRFLGLFGDGFKSAVCKEIDNSESMKNKMRAFLTLGFERNKMVHENFMDYTLEKTFDEIVLLHEEALAFVDFLSDKIENITSFS